MVTPVGDSPADLHAALVDGRGATAIDGFDPKQYFGARNARPLDRTAQLVSAAAAFALADAQCTLEERSRRDVGLVLGTMFSGVRTICAFDRRAIEVGPEFAS